MRGDVLDIVVADILQMGHARILRVALDGVDGAGKTTMADEIAGLLQDRGQSVIRASVDGFHHRRSIRYRQGRDSPQGFFQDSYDYEALRFALLDPLSPGGSGQYRRTVFNHETDTESLCPSVQAAFPSILIVDGIFMHRHELRDYWDYSIFLHVPFTISIPRGAQRGTGYGSPDPTTQSNQRYIDGQRLYLDECTPERFASVTVDNSVLGAPFIMKRQVSS